MRTFRLQNAFSRERGQRLVRAIGAHRNIRARAERKQPMEPPNPISTRLNVELAQGLVQRPTDPSRHDTRTARR